MRAAMGVGIVTFVAAAIGACSSSSTSLFESGAVDAGPYDDGWRSPPKPDVPPECPPECPHDVTLDGTSGSTVGLGDAGSCVAITKGDQCVYTPPPCVSSFWKKYLCTCDGSHWGCVEDDDIGLVQGDAPCFDAGSFARDAGMRDAADASDLDAADD